MQLNAFTVMALVQNTKQQMIYIISVFFFVDGKIQTKKTVI